MKIIVKKEFKDDYISREAGERLRKKILTAEKNGEKVEIDFLEITIASTSFFDEAIAKLAEEGWDKKKLNQLLQLKNINPKDKSLLEQLCKYRGLT